MATIRAITADGGGLRTAIHDRCKKRHKGLVMNPEQNDEEEDDGGGDRTNQ